MNRTVRYVTILLLATINVATLHARPPMEMRQHYIVFGATEKYVATYIEFANDTLIRHTTLELSDGTIAGGTVRDSGGAFDSRPELSAAFWFNPFALGRTDQLLITNPQAVRPLQESLIATLAASE